ncbi:MAG: superoxide dismutase family protein [Candidatus Peregrinibacteria bacterium]|nr:superoxide dismutase family protein [Candidatus Peregrinibacteria bacterium]
MRTPQLIVMTSMFLLTLTACQSTEPQKSATSSHVSKAVAVLTPSSGSSVRGTVTFSEENGSVTISASLTGLTPGQHGFHIHEWGDINCSDGMCTGSHFNPTGSQHGDADATERHVGDLGNSDADASGNATFQRTDSVLSLNGPHSVIGRAIVVHANQDDFSQPTGNAGGRVAYGVIGISEIQ